MKYLKSGLFIMIILASAAAPAKPRQGFNTARSLALGGAGVALEDISMPISVNPGSISGSDYGRMSFFYGNLSGDSHTGVFEYTYPFLVRAALGAGVRGTYSDKENYSLNYLAGIGAEMFGGLGLGVAGRAVIDYTDGEYAEGFFVDAGINCYPFKWFGFGITGRNIVKPSEDAFSHITTDLRAGVSIINTPHLRVLSDFYFNDIAEEYGSSDMVNSIGVEISVHESLKIRTGVEEDTWGMGLSVGSRRLFFDYTYIPGDEKLHFAEAGIRLGMSPSRKERHLEEQSKRIERDELYLEAVREFGAGRVASADRKVREYIENYGREERVIRLENDIRDWLEKVRQEKMGRARELEKEILKAYYREQIGRAFILMDNLKLIAPHYEEALYLEHLLKARVLLEDGKYEQAEDELVQALKINPDSRDVRDLHRRLREVLRLER